MTSLAANTSSADCIAGPAEGVRVDAEIERAVDALPRAVLADRLAGSQDVVLVEGGGQRRAAVPGRTEADPLRRVGGVRMPVVVGAVQRVEVDQVVRRGRLTGRRVRHGNHPGTRPEPADSGQDAATSSATRRRQRRLPALPAAEQVPGEQAVEVQADGGAEQDVLGERRFGLGEPAAQVVRGELLVQGVGGDVLVEEVAGGVVAAETAQALAVTAARRRRGHLVGRQMADERAAQRAVQPEQRHDVADRERDAGDAVDVGAVAVVEVQAAQQGAVQLGVHAVPAS